MLTEAFISCLTTDDETESKSFVIMVSVVLRVFVVKPDIWYVFDDIFIGYGAPSSVIVCEYN